MTAAPTTTAALSLPLPHAWFEADTALPKARFRAKRLREGGAPIVVAAARALGGRRSDDGGFSNADSTLDESQRGFDAYFDVRRADGAPVALLREAMAATVPRATKDILGGVSVDDDALATLALGLHRLADWALTPTEIDADALDVARAAPDGPIGALERWKTQHHLFFLIVHGMLYLLHVLEEALDKEHAPVVQAILEDFADLMEASVVAFKLAGDFSVEDYEAVIRPDMMAKDPHFSGLFYADHKELVTSLRVLKRVPEDFADEMNRIGDAISAAYDAHALVCLRFVGASSSLASKDESRMAAESIRGKYVKRTKVIAGLGKPR